MKQIRPRCNVRRGLIIRLRLLFATVVLAATPAAAQQPVAAASLVKQVGPIVMTVSDLQRSVDFYSQILTFEKTGETYRSGTAAEKLYGIQRAQIHVVGMKLGDESLELQHFENVAERPIPADARSNDLSFQHIAIIVNDMDAAYRVLRQNHVEHVSAFPQTLPAWNHNAAGIKAFYFKDPDGHPLEILQFPPDKGDLKWHQAANKIFLGIDHTAIVVSDTDASLAFYRDQLGMRVAGESDNYGDEQEHLNNVFGAHLRITSLRAPSGPGIELLEYLSPRDGRPAPADAKPTDVAHHETVIEWKNLDSFNQFQSALVGEVSDFPLSEELPLHAHAAKLISDPDGHVLMAVQP
jgi:catechol 2,3-dioxygenase-like lactoylglutathione lyase family enzyme